ncbi:SGNH/GDSL hydrolase family protein [Flavobacterium sp. GSB-24]|uniref:SGNH/GDSL hydrolase family protein n=1 Tax=Flavobacterium sp. GSB-24 TaxID=2994319 RepID=UPI0024914CB3|nr:SGNH/GDSL hydrolase family protein [Flavobacterium sp. GSB-24]
MKVVIRFIMLNFLLLHFVSMQAQTNGAKFIFSKDKHLYYMGRVGFSNSSAEFYWSGTSVSINVKGTKEVKALLDVKKDFNYYYAIVDGNTSNLEKIKVGKGKKAYIIATFSDLKKHQVELVKITNTDENTTLFYGFEIDKNATVLKPKKEKKRKIEFFGDSITCGHGVDVPIDSTDSGAPKYFNNFKTYDAITARHFDAQYHCTAKSGIGVMVSWFPQIMPEIYDRINPEDSNSKWNFSGYVPDIVVINLFQNDSWIVNMPQNEQFKIRFGTTKPNNEFIIEAYIDFISKIRMHYPNAQIICCLGNMDIVREGSIWPELVNAAVAKLNDKKIVSHFFSYKNTNGHPKEKEQQAMADDLIQFIENNHFF